MAIKSNARKPAVKRAASATKLKFIESMECLPVAKLPEGPEWTYEIKLDGYRLEALKEAKETRLYSRRALVFGPAPSRVRAFGRRRRVKCVTSTATLRPQRYAVLLRCGPARPPVVAFAGVRLTLPRCGPAGPARFAILLRSRTGHYFPVVALATVLLAHSPAFGRFDEI